MKRTITLLTALALILTGSCQRIEEAFVQDGTVSGEKMIFEATIAEATLNEASPAEAPETKSALQSNEKDIYWTPGDAINIFYGSSTKSKFTANITEPFPTASFEGRLGAATGSAEQGISSQSFWGVYPYDEDNTCDGNSVTLKILDRQFASPGSFGNGMNPSVANSPGLSLSFYNVGSWFRFSVSQSGITSATFSGNNDEILAGKVTVKMDSNGKPFITNIENGQTSITVTPEGGGSFVPGKFYYITLIPQTIAGTGYTLTLIKNGNSANCVVADPAKTYAFNRSEYRSKRNADQGLIFNHDYVEMAPGFFWATTNIGASSPENYGDYFAWGETKPKTDYQWSTYFDNPSGDGRTFNKYASDKKTSLDLEDDAAKANWGGSWRMPTEAEWTALMDTDNFTWTWTDDYNGTGVKGEIVTSKVSGYVGNSIFLPAAGRRMATGGSNVGTNGYYWASSVDLGYNPGARDLYFTSTTRTTERQARCWGISVRAVYDPTTVNGHKYVEMGHGFFWATTNVGADTPEEPGDYFAWGETKPKTDYRWATYFDNPSGDGVTFNKYGIGKGTQLNPVDDAAKANWGGNWRMPTEAEWTALINTDNYTWTWDPTRKGYTVTSKVPGYVGNNIFLPAAGQQDGTGVDDLGYTGYYWTSTLASGYSDSGKYLYAPSSSRYMDFMGRCYGQSVRPVYTPSIDSHEYVEMGDGLKWATMNVGADDPTETGDYFAWGETRPKTDYSWATYFDNPSGDGETFTKYATDKKTELEMVDDAARQNWGGSWRMPTYEEWTALGNRDNFTWTWCKMGRVDGYLVTSKVSGYEGNYIFLPAASAYEGTELEHPIDSSYGNYWSSTLHGGTSDSAWRMHFIDTVHATFMYERRYGMPVRAVSN